MNEEFQHRYDEEAELGMPEPLPDDESIVWQGAPTFRAVAIHMVHLRKVALYFAALLLVRLLWLLGSGQTLMGDLPAILGLSVLAMVSLTILAAFAWMIAGTTLYTITTRRVIMRIGIALTMTLNLPFERLQAADVRVHRDGSGDVFMRVHNDKRMGYIVLWPHLRTFRLASPEPALRAIPDAEVVAGIFAEAVRSNLGADAVKAPDRVAEPGVAAMGT